jgi:hypothetical protein
MPPKASIWAEVMKDSWEAQQPGMTILSPSSGGHAYWECSHCRYKARKETFRKQHAPVFCALLAASRGFNDSDVDPAKLFKSTGLPSDGTWRSRQFDMSNPMRSNSTVLATRGPGDLLPCATPLPAGMDICDSIAQGGNADLTRTKRSSDLFSADEGSEDRPDKRTSTWNPVSKYHPVPRPGVRNGTGYETTDICRFVLEAENLIGEPGRWAPLFMPIVEACRLWNRGGPFPNVSLRSNFRNNLSVLTTRVQYADTDESRNTLMLSAVTGQPQ